MGCESPGPDGLDKQVQGRALAPVRAGRTSGRSSKDEDLSTAPTFRGSVLALNACTGKILWRYSSGGVVFAGAAIVHGTVYWGTGYHTEKFGLGYNGDNNKLYAFALNGG